ncbi:MAG: hypothetical protein ABW252_04125 [Polyangiales bacterium]
MLRLAAGLRETQRELDASREATGVRDSERRRLAREVDILSHLLCTHEVGAQRLDLGTDGRDELLADGSDPVDGSSPHGAS